MKKNIVISILWGVVTCFLAPSATAQSLDSLRQDFQKYRDQAVGDFEAYSAAAREDFERYEKQMRAEYGAYVKSIKKVWGNDTVMDTKKEWVEYNADRTQRSVVNFESGDVRVEVALDDPNASEEEVNKKLASAIESMLESRGTSCPYSSKVDEQRALTKQPILQDLVDLSAYDFSDEVVAQTISQNKKKRTPPKPKVKGQELDLVAADDTEQPAQQPQQGETKTEDKPNKPKKDVVPPSKQKPTVVLPSKPTVDASAVNKKREEAQKKAREKYQAQQIANAVAQQSEKKKTVVKGDDGKKRTVVQVQMNLVADNLSKNAALYKDIVAQYSQIYQIEQPLIFAVIEQESSFNPEATSWVPAYGLMQLVPTSGGFDAYRYVYKREWVPTKSYLYNPKQNIELGTAYLRILMNQFSKVQNPDCRRLCVIASYNTGAGNVSRAFTGNTKLGNAFPQINKYNYNALFNHLTTKLNTSEARNYVKRVSERREKYLK